MLPSELETKRPGIVFLFGAGASIPAGIPDIKSMTDEFLNSKIWNLSIYSEIPSKFRNANIDPDMQIEISPFVIDAFKGAKREATFVNKILQEFVDRYVYSEPKVISDRELWKSRMLHAYTQVFRMPEILRSLTDELEKDYETIDLEFLLERINQILRVQSGKGDPVMSKALSTYKNDQIPTLILKTLLQSFIRTKCESITDVEYLWPLMGILDRYGVIDLFTLNYDATIDIFCEKRNIPYTDGFAPNWDSKNFDTSRGIRIYKIHGSVYWFKTQFGKYMKLPAKGLDISNLRYITDEEVSEMLIYPAIEKDSESGPYPWIKQEFRRKLSESALCIILGYSFRDVYIKEMIIEQMNRNPSLWLYIVSPNASQRKREHFAELPDIFSRIVTLDASTERALTGRILHQRLDLLEQAIEAERNAWSTQSLSVSRLDHFWLGCLRAYKLIEHYDRIKEIVEKLYKQSFPEDTHTFSESIEGVVSDLSLRFAVEYFTVKKWESVKFWLDLFCDCCEVLEFWYARERAKMPYECTLEFEHLSNRAKNLARHSFSVTSFLNDMQDDLDYSMGLVVSQAYLNQPLGKIKRTAELLTMRNPESAKDDLGLAKWSKELRSRIVSLMT
ncbi:MAG: hypothetical protein HMLIMOIP_001818 [Candidatus Nitrosomirales archaeon]|jgi:hypothetical protein